jgi:hypothetical protein
VRGIPQGRKARIMQGGKLIGPMILKKRLWRVRGRFKGKKNWIKQGSKLNATIVLKITRRYATCSK